MAHSRSWDETAPNGAATAASDIDLLFRNLKVDIRERLVDLGVTGFAADDPNRFASVKLSNGSILTIAGNNVIITSTDGSTVNLQVNQNGDVFARANFSSGGTISGVLLALSGLATFNGGINVAGSPAADFAGQVTFRDRVILNTGQANIVPQGTVVTAITHTIDFNEGNNVQLQLQNSPTLTLLNPQAGAHYLIKFAQDTTGSRTVTWPASVRWPNNGPAPAMSSTPSRADLFGLYFDGVNYLGSVLAYGYLDV